MPIIIKQLSDEEAKTLIEQTLQDIIKDFFYKDRVEDEELTFEVLAAIFHKNIFSEQQALDLITKDFKEELETFLN